MTEVMTSPREDRANAQGLQGAIPIGSDSSRPWILLR